jgi:hypothetical protein
MRAADFVVACPTVLLSTSCRDTALMGVRRLGVATLADPTAGTHRAEPR